MENVNLKILEVVYNILWSDRDAMEWKLCYKIKAIILI